MKRWLCCGLLIWPLYVWGGQRDTCYTGIYLKNMYDLRPEEYAYTADFWMWFDYRRKGFDPLNNIEIINAKQLSFADPYYANADGHLLLASESSRAVLTHDWKLKNYPFDEQVLQIQLEAGLDTSRMVLKDQTGGLKLYRGLELPGWQIRSYKSRESLVCYDSDFGERHLKGKSVFSRITYEIRIQRNSWSLFFKLLIGLYVSFFVAFLVFFVPPMRDQRFGLSIGGLFAAVGNKYVMDSNIPSTIAFSFVDQVHDLTFLFILATLVLSVFSLRMAEKGKLERAERFDRRAAWVVLALYLEMNLALIALTQ